MISLPKAPNRLRELRENNGLLQKDMAELMGVTDATYCKKELGYLKVSLEEARKSAVFFETTIEEIFFADTLSSHENQ